MLMYYIVKFLNERRDSIKNIGNEEKNMEVQGDDN